MGTPRIGQQVTWRGYRSTYVGTVLKFRDDLAYVFHDVDDEGRMRCDWVPTERLHAA